MITFCPVWKRRSSSSVICSSMLALPVSVLELFWSVLCTHKFINVALRTFLSFRTDSCPSGGLLCPRVLQVVWIVVVAVFSGPTSMTRIG
jgi:hypothetical protein